MSQKEHIFREKLLLPTEEELKQLIEQGKKKSGLERHLKTEAKMILINYYNERKIENGLINDLIQSLM